MFYLHLHCSPVIAQRITAADVKGKNGFSQDDFAPSYLSLGYSTDAGAGVTFSPFDSCSFFFFPTGGKRVHALASCCRRFGHEHVRLKTSTPNLCFKLDTHINESIRPLSQPLCTVPKQCCGVCRNLSQHMQGEGRESIPDWSPEHTHTPTVSNHMHNKHCGGNLCRHISFRTIVYPS